MRNLIYIIICTAVILAACANPGSGPDGGPYDETPPRIVSMTPALGKTNTKQKKVTLVFDENVKLENAAEKVIISPPQIEMPEINAAGRRITVELSDTLKENTTYTIDFSDAIADNNEGNPMGNFTYYFSTGEKLDTMEVAGHVLSADQLIPVKGILVGLHKADSDTAFRTKALERVARTDEDGRFSIKGIAPGNYRIYALQDMDGDFRFSQKGEMIAFSEQTITPSCFADVRHDTLWVDSVRYDTVKQVNFTHYLPDDLVLLAFKEAGQPRHRLKEVRDTPEQFKIFFTAPSDTAPTLRGVGFDAEKVLLTSFSKGHDTITCWVRDTTVAYCDSIALLCSYDATDDSTQLRFWKTDTLVLRPRLTIERRRKMEQEKLEKWEKQRKKRHKRGDFSQEKPPVDYIGLQVRQPRKMSPDANPVIELTEPLGLIDTTGIRLLLYVNDSTTTDAPWLLEQNPYNPLQYTFYGEWRPGQKYEIQVDSACVRSIFGRTNRPTKQKFDIGKMDDFGALFITLINADTTAVVQLLSNGEKVVRQIRATESRADFFYLEPATYYLRLFYDRNGNGVWDTGEYDTRQSPEEVFYFRQPIAVKANWDIEQAWEVGSTPLTQQKPEELLKKKEKRNRSNAHSRNLERERNRR